ncbi:MAG: cytochrome ubiquinol oxidase subunit I [Alphaproteobacteria bacterium]
MLESITEVVALSRIQFAATALYHFLFVPVTLGLSTLVAIMETIYVRTGNKAWRDAAKFWGLLFGINFAMGVATGIPMEFQFGTNWSVYSDQVGDIFGAPLAIEGLMAFFLEATFIGMWFFGWNRLSKKAHCVVGWLMALGATFSAIWILIANGFMQNPVGGELNFLTSRVEMTNFLQLVLNPIAQAKFGHTITGGYVCGSIFVLTISAIYLLKGRNIGFAKRSMTVASTFGLLALIVNIWMGHNAGDLINEYQPAKMAATEAVCEPEEGLAGFNVAGVIVENIKTGGSCEFKGLHIPKVLGMITTSTSANDGSVFSVEEIHEVNKERIKSGIIAVSTKQVLSDKYKAAVKIYMDDSSHDRTELDRLEEQWMIFSENAKEAGRLNFANYAHALLKGDAEAQAIIDNQIATLTQGLTDPDVITYAENKYHYGYGMLLQKYVVDVTQADESMIEKAVNDTVPSIAPNFWAFRIMVGSGFLLLFYLIVAVVLARKDGFEKCRKFLVWAIIMFPFPWICIEAGWFLAEYGRQPWAIQDLLPVVKAVSAHPPSDLWISLGMFVSVYSILLVVELYLMIKYIKLGPEGTKLEKVSPDGYEKA